MSLILLLFLNIVWMSSAAIFSISMCKSKKKSGSTLPAPGSQMKPPPPPPQPASPRLSQKGNLKAPSQMKEAQVDAKKSAENQEKKEEGKREKETGPQVPSINVEFDKGCSKDDFSRKHPESV